jgi:hypothetical protein
VFFSRNINAHFPHHSNRQRIKLARLKPGTVRFKIISANFVEKRFGHLAAGAIVNTDKENFLFHRLLREL